MDTTAKEKIASILERAPLPVQMKVYYKARLEREGISPILIESIKSAMRALENDAFGRTGLSVDEDDDPEIKKAVNMYSAAVAEAADKYLKAAAEAAGTAVKTTGKVAKKLQSAEKEALKAAISTP